MCCAADWFLHHYLHFESVCVCVCVCVWYVRREVSACEARPVLQSKHAKVEVEEKAGKQKEHAGTEKEKSMLHAHAYLHLYLSARVHVCVYVCACVRSSR